MPMTIATNLLGKLREIKTAVERGDPTAIHPMLIEAEDYVLQMERELMTSLSENERIRRSS